MIQARKSVELQAAALKAIEGIAKHVMNAPKAVLGLFGAN